MKNSEKYAFYCRVSTSDQTNENQKIRLIQYANLNGLEYDMFEETESSRKSRPVKQELMNKLRSGKYKAVVVYKLDRFARSFSELILNVQELMDKNIGFISLTDNIDLNTPSGKLQFQILSAFAEFERELIRERTIEGIRRAKKQGKTLGRPIGSKDSKKRKKAGYILREATKRRTQDEKKGLFLGIEEYLT